MERPEMHYLADKYDLLLNEMSQHKFDVIRFSSYRTGSKLRFIQTKTNFNLIDLWNAIEAIRDNQLVLVHNISVPKLESLVTSVYYSLAKRLPQSLSFSLDQSIELLLSWLLRAYDSTGSGRVNVFSVKVAFALMSSGKVLDKLRYIYSLISDSRGLLVETHFNAFLKESLALTASVGETTTFQYDDSLSSSIFDFSQPIDLHTFMSVFITSNSPPPVIAWIVVLHRMADTEHVVHPISCEACNRQPFNGFRYKCQKCFNYNLCQDCFWRGRASGSHSAESHACKEYAYWKSPTKQIGHSLRKSFRCIPSTNRTQLQYIDEPPKDQRFNLSHIVPPSPVPAIHHINGFNRRSNSSDLESLYAGAGTNSLYRSPPSVSNYTTATIDSKLGEEEHRLIARYAASLANYSKGSSLKANASEVIHDISQQQRVISQLETKNREIMKQIQQLKHQTQLKDKDIRLKSQGYYASANLSQPQMDPILLTELAALRQRKEELEQHLSALQESRRELMVQLEGLMGLLKNHGNLLAVPTSAPGSTTSTLNRNMGSLSTTTPTSDSMQSDTSSATGAGASVNRDLLVAADSVTNCMSSLVRELNTEEENQNLLDEFSHKVLINEKIANSNRNNGSVGSIGSTDNKDIEIEERKLVFMAINN